MSGRSDRAVRDVERPRLGCGPLLFLVGFRAHRVVRGWLNLGLAAARSVWVGLFLGVLPRRRVWALDDHYYRSEPRYRDPDHNLGGLADWERYAVERYFSGCRRLAVTAAGGGREVLALTEMGFEVVAEECNPALVGLANRLLAEAGIDAEVRLGPRDACGLVGESLVDGVIVGWGAYTHIQGRATRRDYLRQLRGLVRDRGPILLSFFHRPARAPMMAIVRAVAAPVRAVLGGGGSVELGDVLDPHFQHYFNEAELAGELRSAGFELVEYSPDGYAHAVGRAVDVSASPEAAAGRS